MVRLLGVEHMVLVSYTGWLDASCFFLKCVSSLIYKGEFRILRQG